MDTIIVTILNSLEPRSLESAKNSIARIAEFHLLEVDFLIESRETAAVRGEEDLQTTESNFSGNRRRPVSRDQGCIDLSTVLGGIRFHFLPRCENRNEKFRAR